jgi:hypothetical protein
VSLWVVLLGQCLARGKGKGLVLKLVKLKEELSVLAGVLVEQTASRMEVL